MKATGASQLSIIAASTLAIILSTVGQNSVLGVFLEQQSASLGITEMQFCLLLAISTLLAGAGMHALQGAVARRSTAFLAIATSVGSAAALLLWGGVVAFQSRLSLWSVLLLLTLCFTGIRLFLRGIFKIVGSSVVNEKATAAGRSRMMALSNVLAGAVFALLPLASYGLLRRTGFVVTVILFGVASIVVGILVWRVVSSTPDRGHRVVEKIVDAGAGSCTLAEARRTRRFWTYSMGLPLNTLIQSSASLMLLPIARYAEVDPSRAYSIYLPAMVIGLPCVFFATQKMGRHRTIFLIHQLALVASTLGFLFLDTALGFWAASLGFGVAAALYTAMASNLWPTVYGTAHAKAFYGYATAIDLGASAAGPILFGVVHHFWGVQVALMLVLPLPLVNVALVGIAAGQRRVRTHRQGAFAGELSTG